MPLRGFALIDPGLRLGKVVLSMRMRRSYSLLEPAYASATRYAWDSNSPWTPRISSRVQIESRRIAHWSSCSGPL